MTNIKDELNSTDWAVTLNNPNLQSNYNTFETMLTNILDKHTPVIVKKWKESCITEPWITPG